MSSSSIPGSILGIVAPMVGATSLLPGSSGSTSTPAAGDQTKFQSGGGGFATPTLTGAGTPEAVVTGSIGNQYFDTTANVLYVKKTGSNTSTGWIATATAGAWVSYTPAITAIVNPTLHAGAILSGAYMIQGKTMHLNITFFSATASAAGGTGTYNYGLPPGYLIDTSKAAIPAVATDVSGSGFGGGAVGAGYGRNSTAGNSSGLIVMPLSATTIGAYFEGQARLIGSSSLAMNGASNTYYSMVCQIPIL